MRWSELTKAFGLAYLVLVKPMCATLALAACLALVLTTWAAEPRVDDAFSQNDVKDIRKFIASVTVDPIESIDSVMGDAHVPGAIPREATNTSRDGTRSLVTIYLRTDLASVLTSDRNHVLTEYEVRKGPQGWAMDIEHNSWYEYPMWCLWYLLPGGFLHLLFFALGCICLIFVHLYARSGYRKLIGRWGQFNIVFLLVACAISGFWSCLIFGHFYTSTDYISDFSPLMPITQSTLDERFGYQVGHLYGVTLRQLQFIWMAFAATTWVLSLSIYFSIRRLGSPLSDRPNQSLEPTAGRSEVHS